MEITPIDLREIDQRAGNVYEGIIVTAKRARQINAENKIEFNTLLTTIPEATTDDESEDIDNPAQLKIALEMEQKKKPHLQALNEFLEGKIDFEFKK
jgi:DNA-directed RNA polymerase subunit K/omega